MRNRSMQETRLNRRIEELNSKIDDVNNAIISGTIMRDEVQRILIDLITQLDEAQRLLLELQKLYRYNFNEYIKKLNDLLRHIYLIREMYDLDCDGIPDYLEEDEEEKTDDDVTADLSKPTTEINYIDSFFLSYSDHRHSKEKQDDGPEF